MAASGQFVEVVIPSQPHAPRPKEQVGSKPIPVGKALQFTPLLTSVLPVHGKKDVRFTRHSLTRFSSSTPPANRSLQAISTPCHFCRTEVQLQITRTTATTRDQRKTENLASSQCFGRDQVQRSSQSDPVGTRVASVQKACVKCSRTHGARHDKDRLSLSHSSLA